MGFRFSKSIRILPGLRLNLSKSGVSASVGRPGATVNVGPRGTRATVGLPGSGLSYTQQLTPGKRARRRARGRGEAPPVPETVATAPPAPPPPPEPAPPPRTLGRDLLGVLRRHLLRR